MSLLYDAKNLKDLIHLFKVFSYDWSRAEFYVKISVRVAKDFSFSRLEVPTAKLK